MKISLAKIAKIIDGKIIGDANKLVFGVAPIEDANDHDITFAKQSVHFKKIENTKAGAVIVSKDYTKDSKNLIQVDNPQIAFIKIVKHFHPPKTKKPGISDNAFIGTNFIMGQDAHISPCVVIGDNVTLGNNVALHPNVVLGNGVSMGNNVEIFPNVTICDQCRIGNRVTVQAGTVIGSDGFGYVPMGDKYCKIPHLGIVQIDDDVEIGAGNMIDRGTFNKTWIKSGVKTDNIVHIAHNVTIGENTLLVAQVGISGSTIIGKHSILAGKAGIAGHLKIGNNVTVGPKAGIAKSIPDGQTISGSPGILHSKWLRVQRIISKLPELKKRS